MKAWNFLATGMGGIDWQALPLAMAWLGITDAAGLIARLLVIKGHRPPEGATPPAPTATAA
jgi:hypothetical protein